MVGYILQNINTTADPGYILASISALGGDVTAPTLTGAVTFTGITQSGYTASWPAGADNLAVAGYEYQVGSTAGAWTSTGTTRSAVIIGRPSSTTETVYVRAYDAAGNRSTAISGSVTTLVAPATITVTEPLKNNAGTLLASVTGIRLAVLMAATLESVYELTDVATNASGLLPSVGNAAIVAGVQYHVAVRLPDGGVGITGPITAK